MSEHAQLGVCIPAYKRPGQLERTIRSIVSFGGHLGIPIFIADDACDGTNDAVVEKLQGEYAYIHHHKNTENLGIDRNIRRCAELCGSRYAWLLGEDDRIVPGGVERVLKVLEETGSSYPYYYVNYASVDEDVTFILHEQSLPLEKDLTMSAEDFFRSVAWSMGFIGACVVDAEKWRSVSPEPYFDTYFAHVGVIMEMCRGQQVYLVSDSLVWNRCGTPRTFTWTGSTLNVLGGWDRLAKLLEGILGEKVCRDSVASFEKAHGLKTIKFLCYLRADNAYGPGMLKDVIRQKGVGGTYKLGAFLAAFLPAFLFRLIRWMLTLKRKADGRKIQDLPAGTEGQGPT